MPRRRRAFAGAAAGAILVSLSSAAGAQDAAAPVTPSDRVVLDRVAVRFYAPETGGTSRPRFITERILSFEARLLAMSDQGFASRSAPDERHVRQAVERHVAEELLSSLGIEGGEDVPDLSRLADDARAELEQRIGGEGPLRSAADAENVDPEEVQTVFLRRARAAYYLDHAVTPLLHPDDEQLRDVFRTAAHPFRNRPFEEVKGQLARWVIAERLQTAESSFLQTARPRVKIIFVGH